MFIRICILLPSLKEESSTTAQQVICFVKQYQYPHISADHALLGNLQQNFTFTSQIIWCSAA